ncbi:hypothetical protein [Bacillus sp. FJAT-45350]|uniref:hypothetical protein n=1 Tax=Bacillus sp. FJAT-45350 TaxID=2011014 RepID=UPI0015CD1DC0|nr:hypothetical protein [Bacillus sp. FJAT-45350]
MSVRKQLAITEIKAAVLNVAHIIEEDQTYTSEEIVEKLLAINSMLDDEIQVLDKER